MKSKTEPGDIVCLRYRIEEVLEAGRSFVAKNLATGDRVELVAPAAGDEVRRARLVAAARAHARVEHPNVARVLDVHEDGDRPYLVLERVEGETLARRLERGRLPVEEAIETVLAAARGVAAAHRAGLLHRDLNPARVVLVEDEDGAATPKVRGFGLAERVELEHGAASGTPAYMSPEELAGQPADALCDVYAMGVVLYECLAGVRPFRADELLPLVTEISAGHPAPLRSLAPEVPPALEALVRRAMSPDRAARPPSMQAFIDALEDLEELEPATTIHMRPISAPPAPISAPPPAPVGAPAPASRPPWLLAVASFVIVSTIGVAGLALAAGTWVLVGGL